MKRILIYGDSNTWGHAPFSGKYPETQQWPIILQQLLSGTAMVLQQGLPGRVAGGYEAADPYKNGQAHFEATLRTALPLDYVIIALGSNDVKAKYARTSRQIFDDLMWYRGKTMEIAPNHKGVPSTPKLFYLGVPNTRETEIHEPVQRVRSKTNEYLAKSGERFVPLEHLEISDDGVHFAAADHQYVAQQVFAAIRDEAAY